MRNILEDLYFGKITPNEQDITPGSPLQQAMDQAEDPAQSIDAFVAKKLAGKTADRQTLKKVSDALARRGYRWPDINDALHRYGAETEEEF